ncbi:BQ5605_C028g10478 [Microbotryum silenes-dioicae]|uniref:BQ5605_C028g10478 protein n=1 Tax=Microbotryum silenes-dioicae TaxID=796604 RepID=A0A2X0PIR9_9BASI|nr:BQ5605_C028g10478 [Microbotryum silenes-dioicae]
MSRMNTRAVLALVLVASLQALASPITGITFAAGPEQALAVRAPAPAAAATAFNNLARLLNHMMIEPGLAIRAADESESEDTEEAETDDEAEVEETVEEVIERRGNSRVFAMMLSNAQTCSSSVVSL